MKKILVLIVMMLLPVSLAAQELDGVKCIMMPGKDVNADMGVEYNGGMVYFCCKGCAGKFSKDPDKFAAMANYQMVTSGQFVQTACPVSGREVADDVSAEIGDLSVGLCCNGCKKKIDDAAEMGDKVAIAFSTEAFGKGFARVEDDEIDLTGITCMMMPDDEVDAEVFVEHNGGKIFFCCDHCVGEYKEDPEKYAALANRQLVQTGQYVQTGCPFSGRPAGADKTVKIGEMEIGFCCDGCKGKVAGAEDDDARVALVFSADAFKKGFAARKPEK